MQNIERFSDPAIRNLRFSGRHDRLISNDLARADNYIKL